MTRFENLARRLPHHLQRIVELTTVKELLDQSAQGRFRDLTSLFRFGNTPEGFGYWWALATGRGYPR